MTNLKQGGTGMGATKQDIIALGIDKLSVNKLEGGTEV